MKTLFWMVFVLTFFANQTYGQQFTSISGFTIQAKDVIWTQVYPCSGKVDSIYNAVLTFIQKNRPFAEIKEHDGEIITRITHFWVDSKRNAAVGSNSGFNGFWDADVTIQVKDGKYRAIVSNIIEDQGFSTSGMGASSGGISGGGANSKQSILDLSSWILTSDRLAFKNDKVNKAVVMNNALSDLFDIKKKTVVGKDW